MDDTAVTEQPTDEAKPQILATVTALEPIDSLIEHPENPRRGSVSAIVDSIKAHGFYGYVMAQTSTRHVLIGNHRLRAAREVGLTEIPVMWADVDDDEARRLLLQDNRTGDLAGYDDAVLRGLLTSIQTTEAGLLGTGFNDSDLKAMFDAAGGIQHGDGSLLARTDVSVAEPVHQPTKGDHWILGAHHLFVADVITDWPTWSPALADGMLFVPYPGPYLALSERAERFPCVLVQPETYVAGHILDKWDAVHADAPAELVT